MVFLRRSCFLFIALTRWARSARGFVAPNVPPPSKDCRGLLRGEEATNGERDPLAPPPRPATDCRSLGGDEECLIPEPRWRCPQWDNVCSQTGITLSRYMMELTRLNPELAEVESIVTSLQVACKTLSHLVRTSSLSGLTGLEAGGGSVNVQGEEQKKLDVLANDVMKNALRWTGRLGTLASEEEDAPVDVRGNKVYSNDVILDNEGRYIAVFDPLDGSSNIDAGIPVGAYFAWGSTASHLYGMLTQCILVWLVHTCFFFHARYHLGDLRGPRGVPDRLRVGERGGH
jgi:Fructose-1-6-bisphosphatase, N-terminal domain